MPTAVESPIDFRQLKATLAGSDRENPVNCVVASFSDRSIGFAVDRRRPGKLLARDLKGAEPARYFHGTAYYDTFPGTIFLTLDRSPRSLALRLRLALRGSGFGNVDIVIADGADEEEY